MKKIVNILSWSTFQSSFKFLNISYLQKWSIFGILIGVIAGASAIGVSILTAFFTSLFLDVGAGFVPPVPGIERGGQYSFFVQMPWMFPIIGAIGGLVVGLIFYKTQSRGEGGEERHGTDSVIDAFHNRQGDILARIPFITAITSSITIGSGGSGGLEGPMSQIGAGFSSVLGRIFKFDASDRRIAVAAGLAAGIGSIFKIPLGAALFSTEVFYRQDFEVKALVPSVIASVAGYTVVGFILGWDPIFSLPQDAAKYSHPESLLLYGIIGLVSAAISMAYVRLFHYVNRFFLNLRIPVYLKPAIGGAAVGAIAMVAPQVLGSSYGWLQLAMLGSPLLLPIWIILGVMVLKIIATSVTIGSGGSAGVFAPTMVIGGLLGAFLGGLFHLFGLFLWIDVSATAIVGMVAFFCATAKTPIATIVMGSELTSGYGLLAPMMIATVVAYAASSLNSSIFKSQVTSRKDSPAHKLDYDMSVLRTLKVRDAMNSQFVLVRNTARTTDVLEQLEAGRIEHVIIIGGGKGEGEEEDDGDLQADEPYSLPQQKVKVATLYDVSAANAAGISTMGGVNLREALTIAESDSLIDAFNILISTGNEIILVHHQQSKIIGKLSFRDIAQAYHLKIHNNNNPDE